MQLQRYFVFGEDTFARKLKEKWLFIWFFAQFALSLASISAHHDAFGYQSSMKNVAIRLVSMFSLLRNGVTPMIGILKKEPASGDEALIKER